MFPPFLADGREFLGRHDEIIYLDSRSMKKLGFNYQAVGAWVRKGYIAAPRRDARGRYSWSREEALKVLEIAERIFRGRICRDFLMEAA